MTKPPSTRQSHNTKSVDTSDFKCLKSGKDGSTYFGQVHYVDLEDTASKGLTLAEYEASTMNAELKA
jgi:hypothetical protein